MSIVLFARRRFAMTKGTLFYRLRTDPKTVMCVIVLMAYGCPPQAIVKAFGFDERTVKSWWQRAGQHCENVHQHLMGQSQLDLQQVQADEIKANVQGGSSLVSDGYHGADPALVGWRD